MRTVHLTLYGDPVPKARARTWRDKKGSYHSKTPDPTSHAENNWRDLFITSGQSPFPPETPLEVTVTAYIPRPKSAPKKRARPITRPDCDNLFKLVTDALEKLAYDLDSRIVDVHIHKEYATYPDPPRTELVITEAA